MKMGIASGFEKPFEPKNFAFKPIYQRRISSIDIHQSAIWLGKLSSLIFSITFFFLLISIGFATLASHLFIKMCTTT